MLIISKARATYIGIPKIFVLFLDHCVFITGETENFLYTTQKTRSSNISGRKGFKGMAIWVVEEVIQN